MTRTQAILDMSLITRTAWNTSTFTDRIKFDNVTSPSSFKDSKTPWCRQTLLHTASEQITLAGATGSRTFRRLGLLNIQIFTLAGTGLNPVPDLVTIMRNAFEGVTSPNGVRFRAVTVNEIGVDGKWFRVDIVSNFEYDELK